VDQEPELNPSVRTTLPEADLDDRTLEEVEDDPEPIKIVP
jgi:hypothetical protein